ncbi:hypothetical protein [Streptomyces sp. 5-10]|uniref:hypothetical protein n=1 Tax=Streptomyces sp. 5-10 TaxID=878925 RepID=UPI00168A64F2|nr:hypothetical protein [Streptomyces sp. 5-10]MBD3004822.1 hypothetical protein [Streptomyces sp. 5-10]
MEEQIVIQRTAEQRWRDYQDLAAMWNRQGRTVRQIAAELGVSKTTASHMVQLGLARAEGRTFKAADIQEQEERPAEADTPDEDPLEGVESEQPVDPFEAVRIPQEAPPEPVTEPVPEAREAVTEEGSAEAAWPMSQDEMKHLAKMHKASHYEPETWPHWAKKLELSIDNRACLAMEQLFPDQAHRERVVYEDIKTAIHTGRNSLWKWTGLNLSLVLPQHKLFIWCQMNGDGKTMEIKFVKHDKR